MEKVYFFIDIFSTYNNLPAFVIKDGAWNYV